MIAKIFLKKDASDIIDENIPEQVGDRIHKVRKHLRLTQKNFASKVGVTQAYLSEIELNKKTPSESVLLSLASAYELDYSWLSGSENKIKAMSIKDNQNNSSTGIDAEMNMIPLFKRLPQDFNGYEESHKKLVLGYVSFPEAPPGACALVVKSDCFNTFSTDDYAIFVCGERPESGDLVVAKDEWGDAIIRQYREKDGERFFTTGNQNEPPVKVEDDSQIIGKIVDGVRRVKF